eukprot:9486516-Pyramimonas_sp.AAC.1
MLLIHGAWRRLVLLSRSRRRCFSMHPSLSAKLPPRASGVPAASRMERGCLRDIALHVVQ